MIIILGPTCVGKTSLGIKLCKKFNGEIISADSRQIYKYMNVGTGKLPVDQEGADIQKKEGYWIMDGIQVHGYDLCNPCDQFFVSRFSKWAGNKIMEIENNGKEAFIVGGTGFYINSLLNTPDTIEIPPNDNLRNQLSNLPIDELQEQLPKDILKTLNNSDKNNPRRLIRKIEIYRCNQADCISTKQRVSLECKIVMGLKASRKFLYTKTDEWVEGIFDKLIEETKNLIDLGFGDTEPLNGFIYKDAIKFVDEKSSKSEAIQKIKFDMHSYIRRQQTYFKKIDGIKWIDVAKENFDKEVESLVKSVIY